MMDDSDTTDPCARRPDAGTPGAEALTGRVLVADDNPANRLYLRKLLTARGCEVTEASDGAAALQQVRKDPPDLALVDVVMPEESGYVVCRRMKQDPLTQDIPVILVTARTHIEDIEAGFVAGAFDYIRKPFNPRELVARVRNALALKRSNEALRLWKRRMSRELEIAGSLQRKLFSTRPVFGPGYEVHLAYQPSQTVGGDVFDALPLPDGGLCVYVGDVAGHGVAPAIVASLLKAIITEAVRDFAPLGPAAICREIQLRFRYHVENPELYATLFLAILSPDRTRWTCMNCGHPDPILAEANGATPPGRLTGGGDVPIGFTVPEDDADGKNRQVSAPATPGSKLLLITDGLFESRQKDTGEPCGADRLAGIARRVLQDDRVIDAAGAILEALRGEGFALRADDCSAMTVERVDPATVRLEMQIALDLEAVAETASRVDRILIGEGWAEEAAGAAQLALMEHGTNVIRHGRPPAGSTLFFQLRLTGPVCRMLFRDRGREWDLASRLATERQLPLDSEHGRGLSIIQAVTVHAEFYRRENENIAFFAVSRDYGTSSSGEREA